MARRLGLLFALAIGASLVVAACGGGDETDPADRADATEPGAEETAGEDGGAEAGGAGRDGGAVSSEDRPAQEGEDGEPAAVARTDATYEAGLEAVAGDLEEAVTAIGARVEGSGSDGEAQLTLDAALPELLAVLREAADGVATLQPPQALRADHQRLREGLEAIVGLEAELLRRVEAGDPVGALARAEAIAAAQSALESSLSAEMRELARPLLGIAGALGFLPLAASDLAPADAVAVPSVDSESYLAPLDFPGAERELTLEPLLVGETVLITGQWSAPASVPLGELLDFYEAALRALGAEGESRRLESSLDGVVTVGGEHPFGSALVTVGAGEDGAHLVSVTGSFPARP